MFLHFLVELSERIFTRRNCSNCSLQMSLISYMVLMWYLFIFVIIHFACIAVFIKLIILVFMNCLLLLMILDLDNWLDINLIFFFMHVFVFIFILIIIFFFFRVMLKLLNVELCLDLMVRHCLIRWKQRNWIELLRARVQWKSRRAQMSKRGHDILIVRLLVVLCEFLIALKAFLARRTIICVS